MTVLEDALQLAGPDDDALVRPAAGEPLAVLGIADAVDCVLFKNHFLSNSFVY